MWKTFLGLDSDRYPLNSYGDMAFRVFGNWARHGVNILQSVQLLLNVAIIVVVNGQSLEEIVTGSGKTSICYVILIFIWAVAGNLFPPISISLPHYTPSNPEKVCSSARFEPYKTSDGSPT